MTFIEHIRQECGTSDRFRDILDNLEDDEIIDSINNYVSKIKTVKPDSKHSTIRKQLWMDVVCSYTKSLGSSRNIAICWADYILKAFDDRFENK